MIRQWMQMVNDELVLRVRGLPSTCRLPLVSPGERELSNARDAPEFIHQLLQRHPDADVTPPAVLDFLLRTPHADPPDWTTVGTHMLRTELMPHQRLAIDRIVCECEGRAALNMDTGTGKSGVALGTVAHYGGRTLILASALTQWVNESKMWTNMNARWVRGGGFEFEPEDEIIVTTYRTLVMNPALQNERWTNVVVDECHMMSGDCPTNRLIVQVCGPAKSVLMLSATPMKGRPKDTFNQLMGMFPHVFPDRKAFEKRYCDGGIGRWGYYEADGCTNPEELHAVMRRIEFTCDKKEVLTDLPEMTIVDVDLPVDLATIEEFTRLNAERDEITKQIMDSPQHLREALMNKSKAMGTAMNLRTGILKIPTCSAWLLDFLAKRDPKDKVLAFAIHKEVLDGACAALKKAKIPHIKIHGDTPGPKRDALIAKINDPNDHTRVGVLSLGTSSKSYNITGANVAVLMQMSYTPSENTQAMGRIHRKGATKPIDVYRLISRGTYDDTLLKIHTRKEQTIEKVFKRQKM